MYDEAVPDVQTLQQRAHLACDAIRTQPETFERVRQSMMRRVPACVASHGGHFEHLLRHGWDSGHVGDMGVN